MTQPARFGARLADAMAEHGPLCAGIDPHPELLRAWGLPVDASGVEQFALRCVEALTGEVAVLKPQSAFFESHGSAGVAALERTLAAARDAGTLVLLDAKRGDIGSTMEGYAAAYLVDGAPLAADAITLSPYLGMGALTPAFDAAAQHGRGLFLLARTSNPDGVAVQSAEFEGRSVAQSIVDAAAGHNAEATPLGDIGVVVGATTEHGLDLATLNGPVLAPGFGSQGATPSDLPKLFRQAARSVLPAVSRELLRHGPDPSSLRSGARRLQDAFARALDGHDR
ncbi:MAG: orotidine 5-phosphate decarboxylase [Pseudonocardia sp.]|nr:orotidine 5-phosphate decarboxylase [Pseudonocardia sp.]